MKFGVVVFPGSNCDRDMQDALQYDLGQEVVMLWHKDTALTGFGNQDCIVLPGGFSYGDYLRCGAIARFSPIMQSVTRFAAEGGKEFGVCNGFQILCESQKTLNELESNHQVIYRYSDEQGRIVGAANPNGSLRNIAGICNKTRNVYGMMPHPERACSEALGNIDGKSILHTLFINAEPRPVSRQASLVNI